MENKITKAISHSQFYTLCNALLAGKDNILKERPTSTKLAERLSRELNFPISESTVRKACRAVSIQWNPTKTCRKPSDISMKQNHTRALTNALVSLYQQLGVELPVGLYNVFTFYNGPRLPLPEGNKNGP